MSGIASRRGQGSSMDRTSIIAGLELLVSGAPTAVAGNLLRQAAGMLRADEHRPHDAEELHRLLIRSAAQRDEIVKLQSRGHELRASDEKKAERIEKLEMFVDATLAARHWYEGHPEGALEEIEKRANDLLDVVPHETEQPCTAQKRKITMSGAPVPSVTELSGEHPYVNTARDACVDLAARVQQCATDIDTRNPSIYNAALTWQRLEELRAKAIRGCLLAGPGRGDCEHFVGLPKEENRETTDEYGRPHGWCQVCWLAEREWRMCNKVRELSAAAVEFVRLDSMPHTLPNAGNARIARDKLFELAGGESEEAT